MSHTVWALIMNCFALYAVNSKLHDKNRNNPIHFRRPLGTQHVVSV